VEKYLREDMRSTCRVVDFLVAVAKVSWSNIADGVNVQIKMHWLW
jgi:hypothetical protein